MGYIIIIIVILGLILWQKGQTKQISAKIAVDTKKSIIERNQDIIQEQFGKIYEDSWPYYVENKVRDCIDKIANREGRPQLAPKAREWLSVWEKRADIPTEYQDLKNHLKAIFQGRFDEVKAEQKQKRETREREEEEAIAKEGQELFERNKGLIDKFLEITERKVSVIDDYGDENWEVLPDEIQACIKKIAQLEELEIDWQAIARAKRKRYITYHGESLPDEYEWLHNKLEETFKEYHEAQKSKPTKMGELANLSGIEFETWIAKLLKAQGFEDVRGTPATGDQGADLITKHNGKTIIIQAKRYQGTVGNKAVQEVISAVGFYGGDEGWVITNSTFTPSAKSLAHKTNIKLFDGIDLQKIADGEDSFLSE